MSKCQKCGGVHPAITCTEIPSDEMVTVQCGDHKFHGTLGAALQHLGFYMEELQCAKRQVVQRDGTITRLNGTIAEFRDDNDRLRGLVSAYQDLVIYYEDDHERSTYGDDDIPAELLKLEQAIDVASGAKENEDV